MKIKKNETMYERKINITNIASSRRTSKIKKNCSAPSAATTLSTLQIRPYYIRDFAIWCNWTRTKSVKNNATKTIMRKKLTKH